jgi:hypothetical protein
VYNLIGLENLETSRLAHSYLLRGGIEDCGSGMHVLKKRQLH